MPVRPGCHNLASHRLRGHRSWAPKPPALTLGGRAHCDWFSFRTVVCVFGTRPMVSQALTALCSLNSCHGDGWCWAQPSESWGISMFIEKAADWRPVQPMACANTGGAQADIPPTTAAKTKNSKKASPCRTCRSGWCWAKWHIWTMKS